MEQEGCQLDISDLQNPAPLRVQVHVERRLNPELC